MDEPPLICPTRTQLGPKPLTLRVKSSLEIPALISLSFSLQEVSYKENQTQLTVSPHSWEFLGGVGGVPTINALIRN